VIVKDGIVNTVLNFRVKKLLRLNNVRLI